MGVTVSANDAAPVVVALVSAADWVSTAGFYIHYKTYLLT